MDVWLTRPPVLCPQSCPRSCPPSVHLLSSWHGELAVALSTLRSLAANPAAAAEWLLSVASALRPNQPRLGSLGLLVSHLVLTGPEPVCLLALRAVQALGTADPAQVGQNQSSAPSTSFSIRGGEVSLEDPEGTNKVLESLGAFSRCSNTETFIPLSGLSVER